LDQPTSRRARRQSEDTPINRLRSRAEITGFFDGLKVVDPGVVFLPEWRPDRPVSHPLDLGGQLYLGGMGRKPS
jgi:hypothetical protein